MWVQLPSDTPYTHLVQWLEHQAYTLGVEGSNPSVSTTLEFQSGSMAQTANLLIRGFKSQWRKIYGSAAQVVDGHWSVKPAH